MTTARRIIILVLLALACIASDRVVKWSARQQLAYRAPVLMLGGGVRLEYVENKGAFLGLGSGWPPVVRTGAFVVGVSIVLVLLLGWCLTEKSLGLTQLVAAGLILGGGAGNLIDRVHDGAVIDFIVLGWGLLRTGVFNLADLFVTVGVVLFLFARPAVVTPATTESE